MAVIGIVVTCRQKNAGNMTLYTLKRANGSFALNSFCLSCAWSVLATIHNVRQIILE